VYFDADGRRRHDVTVARRAAVSPFCVLQVLHFCTFLLNPHFYLESDYIIRKPIKRHFQQHLMHKEILSTFHTRTILHSAHSNQWTECADTRTDRQRHKSENSISARLAGYKNNDICVLNAPYCFWNNSVKNEPLLIILVHGIVREFHIRKLQICPPIHKM